MEKICKFCEICKPFELFYKRNRSCIECYNKIRRGRNKKSICGCCKNEFRPDVKGRYKFCSIKCRFINKVIICAQTGCWIWTASLNRSGYATFVPEGRKSGLAHRESYKIFKGPIDDSKCVLHSCHNRKCVSPDHLRIGTPMENTQDRIKAGRTTNHGKKKE